MKSNSLRSNNQEPFLKVIKNQVNRKKSKLSRIYVNTLTPDFSYKNSLGETIFPRNCVLL